MQSCLRVRFTLRRPLGAAAQAQLALVLIVRAESAYSVNSAESFRSVDDSGDAATEVIVFPYLIQRGRQ